MPNDRPAAITAATLAAITAGYLECAAWADAPGRARFTAAARRQAAAVCAAFVEYVGPELAGRALAAVGPAEFGRGFWLTRCGHGSGFWDCDALSVPPVHVPAMLDRDGSPMDPAARGDTLGDALSVAAYGSAAGISPFAYPSLTAWRGWLSIDGSAEHAAAGHPSPWGYWAKHAAPLHGRTASI